MRSGIPLNELVTDHTHPDLVAMISALRDEMATRFNALADEVDKIRTDVVAEKVDEPVMLIGVKDREAIKALKTDFKYVLEALESLSLEDDPLIDAPLMTDKMRLRIDEMIGDI